MMTRRLAVAAISVPALIAAAHLGARAEPAPAPRHAPSRHVAAAPRSVWDSVFTEEQANRGETFFTATCERCHGKELKGDVDNPPLAGAAFVSKWNGLTVGDLFDQIRTSMPPDTTESIAAPTTADAVAYILRYNTFPAGKTELPAVMESLTAIKIEAAKSTTGMRED